MRENMYQKNSEYVHFSHSDGLQADFSIAPIF